MMRVWLVGNIAALLLSLTACQNDNHSSTPRTRSAGSGPAVTPNNGLNTGGPNAPGGSSAQPISEGTTTIITGPSTGSGKSGSGETTAPPAQIIGARPTPADQATIVYGGATSHDGATINNNSAPEVIDVKGATPTPKTVAARIVSAPPPVTTNTVSWYTGNDQKFATCCEVAAPPTPAAPAPQPAPLPAPAPDLPPAPTPAPAPVQLPPPVAPAITPIGPIYSDMMGNGIRNLDVLFVPYTTKSMASDRVRAVSRVSEFISKFPRDSRINFGILPAHCMDSARNTWRDAIDSRLYKAKNESPGAPAVLSTKSMDSNTIQKTLTNRMNSLTIYDPSDCAGESGFASLFRTLRDEDGTTGDTDHDTYYNMFRAQNMYNPDAALMIVFIANNSDVCSDAVTNNPRMQNARIKYCVPDQNLRCEMMGNCHGGSSEGQGFAVGTQDTKAGSIIDFNSVAYYLDKKIRASDGSPLPVFIVPTGGQGYVDLAQLVNAPFSNPPLTGLTLNLNGDIGKEFANLGPSVAANLLHLQNQFVIADQDKGHVIKDSVVLGLQQPNGTNQPLPAGSYKYDEANGQVYVTDPNFSAKIAPGSKLYLQYDVQD